MRIQLELKEGIAVRPQIDEEGYLYLSEGQIARLLDAKVIDHGLNQIDEEGYLFTEDCDHSGRFLFGRDDRDYCLTLADLARTGRRCGGYPIYR